MRTCRRNTSRRFPVLSTGPSTPRTGAASAKTTASTRSTRTTLGRESVATATQFPRSTDTVPTIPRVAGNSSVRRCAEEMTGEYPPLVADPPSDQPSVSAARPHRFAFRERKPPLRGLTRPLSRVYLTAPTVHRKRGRGRAGTPGSAAERAARTGPRAPIAARTCSTSRKRPFTGRPGSPSVSPEPGG